MRPTLQPRELHQNKSMCTEIHRECLPVIKNNVPTMQYFTGIQQSFLHCYEWTRKFWNMHHDLLVNQIDDYAPAIKPLVHTTLTNIKQLSALLWRGSNSSMSALPWRFVGV